MSNIKTWNSGIGIVTEDGECRYVHKPKTYSTHQRAIKYGGCRSPAPIKMLGGETRWIALPFWRVAGGCYLYVEH